MKLPRYLQFALLITGALVLYSLVDDAPDGVEEIAVVQRPAATPSAPAATRTTVPGKPAWAQ